MSKNKPTDDELIAAIVAGGAEFRWAINFIYKDWFKAVSFYMLFIRGSQLDAEEVFHDALLALVQNIIQGTYQKQDNTKLKSYFLKIFKKRFSNYKRKNKRPLIVEFDVSIHDRQEIELEDNYYKAQLKIHLKKLSDECQKLIQLQSAGYTYEDIVEKVGQSIASIKRKVPDCRKKLYLLANPESK